MVPPSTTSGRWPRQWADCPSRARAMQPCAGCACALAFPNRCCIRWGWRCRSAATTGIDGFGLRRTEERRQLESVVMCLGRRHIGEDAPDRSQDLIDAWLAIRAVSTHYANPAKRKKTSLHSSEQSDATRRGPRQALSALSQWLQLRTSTILTSRDYGLC